MSGRLHRSDCPIGFALGVFGDRWTLLVVRDLALRGKRSFTEFQASAEGISTSVLADRLARLERWGIVGRAASATDGRRGVYRLTERGADLIPVLVEIILWSARHDPETVTPASFVRRAERDREGLIAQLREAV